MKAVFAWLWKQARRAARWTWTQLTTPAHLLNDANDVHGGEDNLRTPDCRLPHSGDLLLTADAIKSLTTDEFNQAAAEELTP